VFSPLLIGCGFDGSLFRLSPVTFLPPSSNTQFRITNLTHIRTLPSPNIAVAMFSARSVASVSRTGVRTFAAAAAPSKSTKPPVALFGVDGTYASALVSPAIPQNRNQ